MKLQYFSDLHLEMSANIRYLMNFPLEVHGDIAVIAGDLFPLSQLEGNRIFFHNYLRKFKKVFWLPGNHEYYHGKMSINQGDTICEQIEENVFLVDNYSEIINNTKLIFTTLWSNISPKFEKSIENGMNDFRVIKLSKDENLTVQDYNTLHTKAIEFLRNETSNLKKTEKTIVISHHVPTFKNYPLEYLGSPLNSAFATELSDFIESSNIDYWIYGHNHRNIPDFKIGKTTLLTNQLGYVGRNENENFTWNKTLEI